MELALNIIEHNGYKELEVTFEEFIQLIRPDDISELEKYFDNTNGSYIFRGQSDSTYDLKPSIFRQNIDYSYYSKRYDNFCYRQYVFLKEFIRGCDLNASLIPGDSHNFRDSYIHTHNSLDFSDPKSWPNKKLYELIGLAQHYGYPTEFLDWSYNPLVACYFAASRVLDQVNREQGFMSIWVFDLSFMYKLNLNDKDRMEIINIPRSLNCNISAQEGCFTLVRQNIGQYYQEFDCKEVETVSSILSNYGDTWLLKITLNWLEAPNLFEYCSSYRINAATLFRDYNGAARYAKDSMNLNRFCAVNKINRNEMNI